MPRGYLPACPSRGDLMILPPRSVNCPGCNCAILVNGCATCLNYFIRQRRQDKQCADCRTLGGTVVTPVDRVAETQCDMCKTVVLRDLLADL